MNTFFNEGGQQYNAPGGVQNFGVPPEQIGTLIAQAVAPLSQKVAEAGLKEAAILRLAQSVAGNVETFDEAIPALEEMLKVAIKVQEEGRHGSNLGSFIDEVLRCTTELSAEGEYMAAISELDEALAREEAESQARTLRLLNAAIDQHLLAFDAGGAASKIARRLALEQPDPDKYFEAVRAEQNEWHVRGRDKGLRLDLEVAIALARIAVRGAESPVERAVALNDLGSALATLGERETGTGRLEAAVTAYRNALLERSREAAPLDWATAKTNLGNALAILGERETGTGRLEEAVVAYRDALTEWSREHTPLRWATTQSNLGTALRTLGARENGTAQLEAAVAAYRNALAEQTRERSPMRWAMTLNNIGNALVTLGERESGTDRLEEAVAAYREALTEWTRERVPLQWAMTQSNLGTALASIGERETVTDRLKASVEAYRNSLEERTRERVPMQWAITRNNMANLHLTMFDKTGDMAELDLAQAALDEARDVFTEAEARPYLAMADEQQAVIDALRRA